MAINEELTWAEVNRSLESMCKILIREGDAAEELRLKLLDAQDGDTNTTWAIRLFNLVDTGPQTLTIDATAKTVKCLTGANLFTNIQVGQDVKTTFFSVNPTNNQTTLCTGKPTADTVEILNAAGLVNETDSNAQLRQQSTASQDAKVAKAVATAAALGRIYTAIQAEIALLRDFT